MHTVFGCDENCKEHLGVALPFNIRLSNADVFRLGNSFSSISMFLPLQSPTKPFSECLASVLRSTMWAKRLPEAFVGGKFFFLFFPFGISCGFILTCGDVVAGCLLASQALFPLWLTRNIFDFMCSKVKCSISNVRGNDKPLHYNKGCAFR